MKEEVTAKWMDYLDGLLSEEEKQQLDLELRNSEASRKELQEVKLVWEEMNNMPDKQPGFKVRQRFYEFLELEESQQVKRSPDTISSPFRFITNTPWGIAAAIALLVIGVGFGWLWNRNQLQQQQINNLVAEVSQTRKVMILSMLEKNSASERIKAVNTINPAEVDPQITEALIRTLNEDDNVNVRLKAATALSNFTQQPEVVDALIASLGAQNRPEVQIALIDILVQVGNKKAAPQLKHIMESDSLMDIVKTKAAYGLGQLL